MSVIIKGLEMPKSCCDCPMCYDMIQCTVAEPLIDFCRDDDFDFRGERHPRCPLILLNEEANA